MFLLLVKFNMCQKDIWLCHCCEINVIDVNFWKCFYSLNYYTYLQQKNDPNHTIDTSKFICHFEMCSLCKKVCFEKCKLQFAKKSLCICQ